MSEQIVLKEGAVITAHLGDYKLPTIMDIPELETVLLPGGAGPAPFETAAIGEMSNVAVPAAITNAVFDAVGVRLVELPVSAEKVLEGMSEKAQRGMRSLKLTVNGTAGRPRGRGQPAPRRFPARGFEAHGHQGGLQRRRVRRLHRPARRRADQLLPRLAAFMPTAARSRPSKAWPRATGCIRCRRRLSTHGGFQCGICTPGQIMAAKALLEANPHPTRAEIQHWMMGNLCRCTGYYKIIESIAAAAGANDVIPFTYLEASSLDETLALLAQHGDEAKLIAGGTGLVNLMKQRLVRPGFVIGLRALKPLAGIVEDGGLQDRRARHPAVARGFARRPPPRAAPGGSLPPRRDRAGAVDGDARRRGGARRSQPRHAAGSHRARCADRRPLGARRAQNPGGPVLHGLFRDGA